MTLSAAETEPEPRAVLRIPVWIDLRHVPVNKRLGLLHAAEEMAAEHVLVDKGDPHAEREDLRAIVVDGHHHLKEGGMVVGRLVKVHNAKTQARAAEAEGIVVVEAEDWRVIPLENLVAARASRPGTLYALAHTPEEAALFAQALESGAHGIVLAPRSPADIFEADRLLRALHRPALASRPPPPSPEPAPPTQTSPPLPPASAPRQNPEPAHAAEAAKPGHAPSASIGLHLGPAAIVRIADGGMGDRVCVDCSSLLEEGEGLLVGSSAASLALVHAETGQSDLASPRPFRVNAGAVHGYVLGPQGKTRYLSELRSGDEALVVRRDGRVRAVTIGRCKVERRPHTLVHWRTADGEASALLQTAETVRLVRPDGSTVAVTDLRLGMQVLVHAAHAARHFGMPVTESVEER